MKKLLALALVLLLLLSGCTAPKMPWSPKPTEAPLPEPTALPTPEPTPAPTPAPTPEPTPEPTPAPTEEPTSSPTGTDTDKTVQAAEQIYARCMPAVFMIEVYDADGEDIGGGSGFFIDENGTAVTNFHVIYGASSAVITYVDAEGNEKNLDVLGAYDWSEEEDWAVLKPDGTVTDWLRIGDPATVVGGATVYALGSPLGLSSTISNGIISNPARDIDGEIYIQTNAAIAPGSSGGALINKFGEVIGITSGGFVYGENMNYAVPMTKLADISLDEVTPLDETYTMPSGLIYPNDGYVTLRPGETIESVITALKYDTEELLTVSYEIEDESLLSCSWDSWGEDDTEVTLHITAGDACGSTTIWLYLYTADSEEMLDYDYIYVSIADGYVDPENSYIDVGLGQTGSMLVTAAAYSGESVKVRYELEEEDIVKCTWGSWSGEQIPLMLEGLETGSTLLTLKLLSADTEAVLAENTFMVYVVSGGLEVENDMLFLAPGERMTVGVTAVSYVPDVSPRILVDETPSDVFSVEWEAVSDTEVKVTITAEEEGYDWVYLSLEDEDGNEINYGWIDVYCSMDGLDPDEGGVG